jgi:hypothetical protein
MAKLLVLLGAGASKPTGTPLMNDFLDRVHEIGVGRTDHYKTVIDLVADLEILHSRSVVSLRNIESVFNIIEMAKLVGRLPGRDQKAIDEAATAMRKVVGETLERTCQFPVHGHELRPPEPYDAFAKFVTERNGNGTHLSVALITFNYDIALDYALMWRGVPYRYGSNVKGDKVGLPLLKLHGSLNWGICECGALQTVSLSAIRDRLRMNGAIYSQRASAAYPVSQFLGHFEHCTGKLLSGPAIVPPSWNKTQYSQSFTQIWNCAAEELASAENILVAGYSLPPTDSFFRDLFAVGMASRTRIKRFIVANPDASLKERFRDLLGPTVRDVYDFWPITFEEVVKKLPKIDW